MSTTRNLVRPQSDRTWQADDAYSDSGTSPPRLLEPRRRLLDLSEAAEYLGTTERHMRRLRYEHRITSLKVGGKVRFDRTDLDAYIDAHKEMAEDFLGVG